MPPSDPTDSELVQVDSSLAPPGKIKEERKEVPSLSVEDTKVGVEEKGPNDDPKEVEQAPKKEEASGKEEQPVSTAEDTHWKRPGGVGHFFMAVTPDDPDKDVVVKTSTGESLRSLHPCYVTLTVYHASCRQAVTSIGVPSNGGQLYECQIVDRCSRRHINGSALTAVALIKSTVKPHTLKPKKGFSVYCLTVNVVARQDVIVTSLRQLTGRSSLRGEVCGGVPPWRADSAHDGRRKGERQRARDAVDQDAL
jgi:hypothetical protein